ncbi:Lipoprotein, partial [Dysosmobacter welbionis]
SYTVREIKSISIRLPPQRGGEGREVLKRQLFPPDGGRQAHIG